MVSEIYTLAPGDPLYDGEMMEIRNERDLLISQIRMILNTENGEVIGDANFGCSLEDMLFEFNLNEAQLTRRLMDQIKAYCDLEPNFRVSVDVKFFQGTVRDGAIIDIFINQQKAIGLFVK